MEKEIHDGWDTFLTKIQIIATMMRDEIWGALTHEQSRAHAIVKKHYDKMRNKSALAP